MGVRRAHCVEFGVKRGDLDLNARDGAAIRILLNLVLALHGVDDHRDEEIKHGEGCGENVDDEEHPGEGVRLHDLARDVGPALQGHNLEEGEKRGVQAAEPLRIVRAEEIGAFDYELATLALRLPR